MKEKVKEQAKILNALGHPARLTIAQGLSRNACNVNKIVAGLSLPQSTVSQHLRVLRQAGVIRGERHGVKICYQVVDAFAKQLLRLL